MRRFQDLTVLVTGATGGFGLKLARRFAAEGARLVLSDLDAERLAETAAAFETPVATLAGTVADERLSQNLVALALDRFGRLDVAVNNAGIVHDFMRLPQTPSDVARRVLEVDLLGMFFALKHQIPALERQFRDKALPGAIVNIASVAGMSSAPVHGYGPAKAAVLNLTTTLAAEWGPRGVRVNAVSPGFTRTPALEAAFASGALAETELTRPAALRRLVEPAEIARAVLWLLGPEAGAVTGANIPVDAGFLAGVTWQAYGGLRNG